MKKENITYEKKNTVPGEQIRKTFSHITQNLKEEHQVPQPKNLGKSWVLLMLLIKQAHTCVVCHICNSNERS